MPVRSKAVMRLVRSLEGSLGFNTLKQVAYIGPPGEGRREISMDEYDALYDGAYVDMIDDVDWNRVFLEASARHLALDHQIEDSGLHTTGDICPECLCEALLAPSWQDWKKHPKAQRRKST